MGGDGVKGSFVERECKNALESRPSKATAIIPTLTRHDLGAESIRIGPGTFFGLEARRPTRKIGGRPKTLRGFEGGAD
jgi:hypothetical protein